MIHFVLLAYSFSSFSFLVGQRNGDLSRHLLTVTWCLHICGIGLGIEVKQAFAISVLLLLLVLFQSHSNRFNCYMTVFAYILAASIKSPLTVITFFTWKLKRLWYSTRFSINLHRYTIHITQQWTVNKAGAIYSVGMFAYRIHWFEQIPRKPRK